MVAEKEIRAFKFAEGEGLEERADGKLPTIRGHAAVFNSLSEDLGGFHEVIRPGAFRATLDEDADVRALVDHDPARIIGRTAAGTLELKEDKRGLKSTIKPADTSAGRDIVESIRRGDVDSMSFAFTIRPGGDKWREEGDMTIREITAVDLYDVSPVTYPAYQKTDVAVRGLEEYRASTGGGEAAPGPKVVSDEQMAKNREFLKQHETGS